MLIPRRVKHRKQHHPSRSGAAKGGTQVTFGDYGIQALEPAYITNRQIESARIAMTRHIKRGGKIWINIFPDRPLTKKPAETRMGSGKGSPEWWIANVKPGRVLFEMTYPNAELELRDGLTCLADLGLLARDQRQVMDSAVDQLGVTGSVADAHVDDNLDHAGDLHDVRVVELAVERVLDLSAVACLEARLDLVFGGGHVRCPSRSSGKSERACRTLRRCGSPRGWGFRPSRRLQRWKRGSGLPA